MKNKKDRQQKPHEFSQLPGFDDAVKKIAGTPRAEVDKREAEFKKRRKRRERS